MRRDYFTCVFLSCVCAALFFVCFTPLYFTYGAIVPRDFSLFERVMSAIYAVMVLFVIPVYAALRKKFWISFGLALYGLFVLVPVWMLPSVAEKVAGEGASIIYVGENFILRSIYSMSRAPFAALTFAIGDSKAESLPNWILGVSLATYAVVQIYRFYRDAYVNESMDPKAIMDTTAKENEVHRNPDAVKAAEPKPEVLGTVISAPATPAAAPKPVTPAPKPTAPVVTPAPRRPEPQAAHTAVNPPSANNPLISDTIHMPPPKANNDSPFDENGAIRL